jgi:hypothetical protein
MPYRHPCSAPPSPTSANWPGPDAPATVYATVLDRVLDVDPRPFLGGRFPTLSLL